MTSEAVYDFLRIVLDCDVNRKDEIRAFIAEPHTVEECERFLSELRDWWIYTGGCADFFILALNALIGVERKYPPPRELTGD